jgi:hypothetical protein
LASPLCWSMVPQADRPATASIKHTNFIIGASYKK